MNPTIIDFGLAYERNAEGNGRCGTEAYMAPEIFNCGVERVSYCTKVDLFGLGVIAHIMMLGVNPIKVKGENISI
jgi:serine/threonine protein kinase